MKARNRSVTSEMDECLQQMQGPEYNAISKDETKQIIALFQSGDRSAGDTLIKSNVILFKSYVLKWKSKYKVVSIDDLFQVVRYGIHEAAIMYRESKSNNASFKTHCHFYVWKHFRIYMRERSIIKVGNNPDPDKRLSEEEKQEIHDCIKVARSRISMETVDIISIDQVDNTVSDIKKENVKRCLETLTDRQNFIISNLFGLNGIPVLTMREIEQELGIKKTSYQHKKNALQKIKEVYSELASQRHLRSYQVWLMWRLPRKPRRFLFSSRLSGSSHSRPEDATSRRKDACSDQRIIGAKTIPDAMNLVDK